MCLQGSIVLSTLNNNMHICISMHVSSVCIDDLYMIYRRLFQDSMEMFTADGTVQ